LDGCGSGTAGPIHKIAKISITHVPSNDFGRPLYTEDGEKRDPTNDDDVVIITMRCWQLHDRRCNNIVRRIVENNLTYQVVYNELKREGILWPLSNDSHSEKRFIHPMVVVESSEL
jgi:hypothetical protein